MFYANPKPPLCKGRWLSVSETGGVEETIFRSYPYHPPAVTALPKGEPRALSYRKNINLPLPLGEVAERSEDGEGAAILPQSCSLFPILLRHSRSTLIIHYPLSIIHYPLKYPSPVSFSSKPKTAPFRRLLTRNHSLIKGCFHPILCCFFLRYTK